jgi:hypothetical protein
MSGWKRCEGCGGSGGRVVRCSCSMLSSGYQCFLCGDSGERLGVCEECGGAGEVADG